MQDENNNGLENEGELDAESLAVLFNKVTTMGDFDLLMLSMRRVAEARGMTQLAKRIGISRTTLYRALKPKTRPTFVTIMKIANALNLTISFAPIDKATQGG